MTEQTWGTGTIGSFPSGLSRTARHDQEGEEDWCGSETAEDVGEGGHKAHILRLDNGWDHAFTEAQLEQMPPLLRDYIRTYAYIGSSKPGLYFISLDSERFINHSHHPNLVENGEFHVAAHDIQQDEELTVNYTDLEELPREEYTYY